VTTEFSQTKQTHVLITSGHLRVPKRCVSYSIVCQCPLAELVGEYNRSTKSWLKLVSILGFPADNHDNAVASSSVVKYQESYFQHHQFFR